MNPPNRRKIGTIGTVLAGQEVRLFDPMTDAEVASGDEGEIRIADRPHGRLSGGAERPIVDGWLRTGDLGRFDDRGFLDRGRIKRDQPRRRAALRPADRASSFDASRDPRLLVVARVGRQSWRSADRRLLSLETARCSTKPG